MNSATQHRSWVLGTYRRAAWATSALAIIFVSTVLAPGSTQAQTYTERVLYSFKGLPDGQYPFAGLVQDPQGNMYGTTNRGGDKACSGYGNYGCGTVFKVDTTGNETVIYSFTGTSGDGALPDAGLVRDSLGNLYGTTVEGGAWNQGTVFKVDTIGNESVLYGFDSEWGGYYPVAGLVRDSKGNLYGTASSGGGSNSGTVFMMDPSGNYGLLYNFYGSVDGDGQWPSGSLVRDGQGNLYGTTAQGGASNEGTVFKLDKTGKEIVLYSFAGGNDGYDPEAGLVRDSKGNLYGTTFEGSALNLGTVFKVDTMGNESLIHSFAGGEDGSFPNAGLIMDTKGNLYGTTDGGGTSNAGTVFKVDKTGREAVIYSFARGGDGSSPNAGLLRDAQGNLYGTTVSGGAYGNGTVFELTPATATTTTLASSLNPSTYGQAVTFTAVVSSGVGAPPDGETVLFMRGTTVLGTGMLIGGSANYAISTLKVGTTSVTATYDGDSNFASSKSHALKQVVNKANQ